MVLCLFNVFDSLLHPLPLRLLDTFFLLVFGFVLVYCLIGKSKVLKPDAIRQLRNVMRNCLTGTLDMLVAEGYELLYFWLLLQNDHDLRIEVLNNFLYFTDQCVFQLFFEFDVKTLNYHTFTFSYNRLSIISLYFLKLLIFK